MKSQPDDNPSDDYELLPHNQILDLRKEIDELKGGPSAKQLHEEMDTLRKEPSDLRELFAAATNELQSEEKEEESVGRKLEKIISQNKLIAEALVTVSDKLDTKLAELSQRSEEAKQRSPFDAFPAKQQMPQQPQKPSFPPQYNEIPPKFEEAPSFSDPFGGQRAPAPFSSPGGQQQMPQQPQPFKGFEPPEFSSFGQSLGPAPNMQPNPVNQPPPPHFDDMPAFDDADRKQKRKGLFSAFSK